MILRVQEDFPRANQTGNSLIYFFSCVNFPFFSLLQKLSPLVRFWGKTQLQIKKHHLKITQTLPVVERITIPPRDMKNIFVVVVFLRSEHNMSSVVFCLKLMFFFFFFFLCENLTLQASMVFIRFHRHFVQIPLLFLRLKILTEVVKITGKTIVLQLNLYRRPLLQ